MPNLLSRLFTLVVIGMYGAENVIEKKGWKANDKKRAQRLCLQQDEQYVSILRARNMAGQHSCRESILSHASYILRDINMARQYYQRVYLPPQATPDIRDRNMAGQCYCQ